MGPKSMKWPTFIVAMGLLAVGIIGAAGCKSQAVREFDAKDVVQAGNAAIEHGQKMQELGARMVEHGRAANDQIWLTDGQHWLVDGKNLVEVGQSAVRLGQSMRGNPIKASEVDINQLRAQGQGLIAQGKALVEHGKVMSELTEVLKRSPGNADQRLARDVADSGDRATQMSESGEQFIRSGQQLFDFADTMAKSIGR